MGQRVSRRANQTRLRVLNPWAIHYPQSEATLRHWWQLLPLNRPETVLEGLHGG